MKKFRQKKDFTLIEVVVALAILTLSLAGLFQLFTGSKLNIARAETDWYEMHMLTQGAEYLLLCGDPEDLTVPGDFFPYEQYTLECEVEDAEGLPDEFNQQDGQMPLKKWTIRLIRNSDGAERRRVVIDRFGYEEGVNEKSE